MLAAISIRTEQSRKKPQTQGVDSDKQTKIAHRFPHGKEGEGEKEEEERGEKRGKKKEGRKRGRKW